MTKEELKKLKETVAYFGHWYDVIGEENVQILEKSIEYIAELEQENAELRKSLVENESDCAMCDFPKQLTKAKELIKKLLVHSKRYLWIADYCNKKIMQKEIAEAEQFLRETDIDNAIQQANEGLDFDKIADEMEHDLKDSEVEK